MNPTPPTSFNRQMGKMQAWAQAQGYYKRQDPSNVHEGFQVKGYGLSAGLSRQLAPQMLVGFMGGISRGAYNLKHSLDKGKDRSAVLGIYGSYQPGQEGINANGSLLVGYHLFSGQRSLDFLDRKARQRHRGFDIAGQGRLGYGIALSQEWHTAPYLQSRYQVLHERGFTEQGAGDASLKIKSHNRHFLQWEVGTELAKRWMTSATILQATLRMGMRQKRSVFNSNTLKARITGLSNFYTLKDSHKPKNYFVAETDLTSILPTEKDCWSLSYVGEFAHKVQAHGILLKLSSAW